MKLPLAKEMRELDRLAMDEFGIPGMVLMENAGLGTVLMMERELGSASGHFALILIGPGNNGGDGLVIGRHLLQRGCEPAFLFFTDPEKLQGDAGRNLAIVRKLGLPLHRLDTDAGPEELTDLYQAMSSGGRACYAIVDAIFGTGLTRTVDGQIANLITEINSAAWSAHIPKIAVDIPSGLATDTGAILGCCFRADHTATYGCAKPGQLFHQGPDACGRLHIIDIGIPEQAVHSLTLQQESLDRDEVASTLASIQRQASSHKGSNGHLLVLSGSTGKTGAAILCVRGALRSGCGLVSLCCPGDLNAIFEVSLIEAMTLPLPESKGALGVESLPHIETHLAGKRAIAIGPGLGISESTAELVLHLYQTAPLPMVIDADAISILARHKSRLTAPPAPRIFTPHPGEMAGLLDCSVADIQNNRLQAARNACRLLDHQSGRSLFVLKGTGTIITTAAGTAWINTTGNAGMATGGMGDVLTGIIGALLCEGLQPEEAARSAVFLHGMAGDMLLMTMGIGYTASEVTDRLPLAIRELRRRSDSRTV